jgi:hypothetical protein
MTAKKLTVLGPNGINDVTFHVHGAGCADISKPRYREARADGAWDIDADTEREVIETCFGDFIGTDETQNDDGTYTTWEDYANHVRFFPCAGFDTPAPTTKTAFERNVEKATRWTADEIAWVSANLDLTLEEIAKVLGRTVNSVRHKVRDAERNAA